MRKIKNFINYIFIKINKIVETRFDNVTKRIQINIIIVYFIIYIYILLYYFKINDINLFAVIILFFIFIFKERYFVIKINLFYKIYIMSFRLRNI